MFICYFALWVVLNGKWTTEIGVFGLVFAAVAYAFTWKYMGYSPKVDLALLRRAPSAIGYGVTLVTEIIKANLAVCRMILTRKEVMEPAIVHVHTDLKSEVSRVILANSITLTPGTITVSMTGQELLVHCLDKSLAEGMEDSEFVKLLHKLEEEAE